VTVVLIFLFYLAAAVLFSLPLWTSAHALIPGGLEDTRLFLWNAWWAHYAQTAHAPLYETRMLFYPFGVSLVTHDMPLWMTLVTDLVMATGRSVIQAVDVWFALTWALNGFCTYLLAREITHRRAPSIVAGLFVMTHAYTLARAMENWGQFNLYALPLFLWLLVRARRNGGAVAWAAGAAFAWTAACHYYFFIYAFLIWLAVSVADLSPWGISAERPGGSLILQRVGILCATIGGLLSIWIIVGKPHSMTWVGHYIGLESPSNALLAFWFGVGLWFVAQWRLTYYKRTLIDPARRARHGTMAAVSFVFLTPLFYKAIPLMLRGGYPRQHILWKTHLLGANLWALFAPNPLQKIWGPIISGWFVHASMDAQEQASMIGWTCLAVVLGSGIWRARGTPRRWSALALVATVLSMGVYLHVGTLNTWCPLPFYFARLVPILENVRVPERWMAVGATAWAVVFALGLVRLAKRRLWSLRATCAMAAILVLCENWPGVPYVPLAVPSAVLSQLREQSPGAVLVLPFYVGDSSIGAGANAPSVYPFPWEHLSAQMTHEKPIVGGYIGRIPRRLLQAYTLHPYWGRLIQWEEGTATPASDPNVAQVRRAVQEVGIRYCLIYPAAVPPAALAFVRRTLPLERIASDGEVELDRITD